MTPFEAVYTLASIVSSRQDFTEDEIFDEMERQGVPADVANRAYTFTQLAWGRAMLDRLGITFSTLYIEFDRRGKVVARGKLRDEPYYAAAWEQIESMERTPGVAQMALMSAEANSVNAMLQEGTNPKELILFPAVVFRETPTDEALAKVEAWMAKQSEQQLAEQRGAFGKQAKKNAGHPWWKLW